MRQNCRFPLQWFRTLAILCAAQWPALGLLPPEAVSVAESDRYRTTMRDATELVVFEGLPHQMWESDQLEAELKRSDTTKIWNYPFYTPGVAATNAYDLKVLLGSQASIRPYGGGKLCGGYHPDFCVSWTVKSITYYVQVCFGCDEIVFYNGATHLKYDMAEGLNEKLRAALKPYAKKRP